MTLQRSLWGSVWLRSARDPYRRPEAQAEPEDRFHEKKRRSTPELLLVVCCLDAIASKKGIGGGGPRSPDGEVRQRLGRRCLENGSLSVSILGISRKLGHLAIEMGLGASPLQVRSLHRSCLLIGPIVLFTILMFRRQKQAILE